MTRRPRYNESPDEHPRPHIDIPFSVVSTPPFSTEANGQRLLGQFVQLWCYAVWKKDPSFRASDFDEATVAALVSFGFVVRARNGTLRHAGPTRDKNWLRGLPKKYQTYAVVAVGTDSVKVGKTLYIEKRLETLQIGSSHRLELTHTWKSDIEADVHAALKDHWISGEWFALNETTRAVLDSMMERVS